MIRFFLAAILSVSTMFPQSTQLKETTPVYLKPGDNTPVGDIKAGTPVTKIKLDPSRKYIKTTIDVYIPVSAFADSRVALPVGSEQVADEIKFKLLSAESDGKQVRLSIKITNLRSQSFDFSAMMMARISASGDNRGELNPFLGRYQDLAIVPPKQSVVADLYFDFKRHPLNVELAVKSKLGPGEEVFYQLGF